MNQAQPAAQILLAIFLTLVLPAGAPVSPSRSIDETKAFPWTVRRDAEAGVVRASGSRERATCFGDRPDLGAHPMPTLSGRLSNVGDAAVAPSQGRSAALALRGIAGLSARIDPASRWLR